MEQTVNYILTHTVIPQHVLRNTDAFYSNVLPHPDALKEFMQTALNMAIAIAQSKFGTQPACPAEKFDIAAYGDSSENGVIAIKIPNAKADCDCIAIAFPIMREQAGYFTCELGFHPITNKPCLIMGGWDGKKGHLQHLNYGIIDVENGENFTSKCLKIIRENKQQIEQELYYDILQNKEGDLLFCVRTRNGEPENPYIEYDGGANALYHRRPEQTILLDEIHPDVRPAILAAENVLFAEFIPENEQTKPDEAGIIREYIVHVRNVNKLPNK